MTFPSATEIGSIAVKLMYSISLCLYVLSIDSLFLMYMKCLSSHVFGAMLFWSKYPGDEKTYGFGCFSAASNIHF